MQLSTCALLFVGTVQGRGLRRGVAGHVELGADASEASNIWVPIPSSEQHGSFFFNPVQGVSAYALPQGAVIVEHRVGNETAAADGGAPAAAPAAAPGQAPPGGHPTIVPLEKRLSCVPHCTWKCNKPVCEQNCVPHCPVPKCETKCPKLGKDALEQCKPVCDQPNCAMFCPDNGCNGTKVLDCPQCTTRCEEPKCGLDCGDARVGCKTECVKPQCEWHCSKPKDCPKPECEMICEQPPDCASGQVTVPVPPDGLQIMGTGTPKPSTATWQEGAWTRCSTQCGTGTQTRTVTCSTGHTEDCHGKQPPTEQACEEHAGCSYSTSAWGECSSRCGKGTRTREVHCEADKCPGEKPASEEECVGKDEACNECKVTIYGGKGFTGWEKSFSPGEYSSVELEYLGVKCDDISSLEVYGEYCHMHAFEYGDFNKVHDGFDVIFDEGRHDHDDLVSAGAKNNDISSFKVYKSGGPMIDQAEDNMNKALSHNWTKGAPNMDNYTHGMPTAFPSNWTKDMPQNWTKGFPNDWMRGSCATMSALAVALITRLL
mmetsp:Transcript_3274/g.7844  ORF Transcript_3274/g.7844 Transcript_3274/m.7844 type:complete len:543 (-) Transcript_3274:122-1750(-)